MKEEAKNEIVVYQPDETMRLDVRLGNDTVWLSQEQMCELFQRDRTVVTKHVRNVFSEGECAEKDNVQILHINQRGRPLTLYSLDVIISVGYRVKSLRGTQFRRWATNVLREYLTRGYAFSQRMNQLEDKVDRRLSKTEQEVRELKEKVDFFVQTQTPPLQGVFCDGQMWDARAFAEMLIGRAKKSILLIDNWATVVTLDMLSSKRRGVVLTVVTSQHFDRNGVPRPKITPADVSKFNSQYPKLHVRFSENFHDRFFIIDNREIYLLGASLKDLGAKCFAFTRLDQKEIPFLKARI
jgi:hypothetical protein